MVFISNGLRSDSCSLGGSSFKIVCFLSGRVMVYTQQEIIYILHFCKKKVSF